MLAREQAERAYCPCRGTSREKCCTVLCPRWRNAFEWGKPHCHPDSLKYCGHKFDEDKCAKCPKAYGWCGG